MSTSRLKIGILFLRLIGIVFLVSGIILAYSSLTSPPPHSLFFVFGGLPLIIIGIIILLSRVREG